MKKFILIVSLMLFQNLWAFSQYQASSGHITELYFDENDNWTLEIYFTYYDTRDTGYLLVSPTNTSLFKKFPDPEGFVVLTQADMDRTFTIRRQGDSLGVRNPMRPLYQNGRVTQSFYWGDFDTNYCFVNAPSPGQSLVRLNNLWDDNFREDITYLMIDTVHSPGYLTRPPVGSIEGYLYDSTGNPLPFMRLPLNGYTDDYKDLWICTDQDGYFRDTTLYAKKYYPYIGGHWYPHYDSFTIEPGWILHKDYTLPIRREVIVEGYCLLSDRSDPAGTRVIFDNLCPGALPDTVYTDSNGYFNFQATVGDYFVRYAHDGFITDPYFRLLESTESEVLQDHTLFPGHVNEILSGNVSGAWEDDDPYSIFGDITLQQGDTLFIRPGVSVNFVNDCTFKVYGTLIVEGSVAEPVSIEQYADYSYLGISFMGDQSSGSRFDYVSFNGPMCRLNFYNSSPYLSNIQIPGFLDIQIYRSSAPVIEHSFYDLYEFPAIYIGDSASPVFRNNLFYYAGLYCTGHASPLVEYNDFYSGSRFVQCYDYANPTIVGNIFFLGDYGISVEHVYGIDQVRYNSFFGLISPGEYTGLAGFCELDTININGDSCDYYHNITKHPRMVDPDNADYHLQEISPCIDAGDPASPMDPDSTIADIGALYFNQLAIHVESIPGEVCEVTTYPNPSQGRITFELKLPEKYLNTSGFIRIFQTDGLLIRSYPITLHEQQTDYHVYDLDVKTGNYFYEVEMNGQQVHSGKLIILNR
jgi:hypothetical protein